jgi:hypothetical protein
MKTKLMMVLLICSCAPHGERPTSPDVRSLEAVAKNVLNIPVAPKPTTEIDENLVALRTGTFTVAKRSDSRTYFVRNTAYGPLSDDGVFDGSEEALRGTAARIFAGLKIDAREMLRERVLHILQGAGELDDATGATKADPWESKQSVLTAERQVDGIPVFSSKLYLALTAGGDIGRLKLHWPEIPPGVLDEARRYQKLVRAGFKPPPGGEVASITAGIIHSSPRSRLLDILPVIRVEYAGGPEGMPRVVYLDGGGQKVRARHDAHPAPPREHRPSR